ncbi:putative ankyrin repeat protein RF_0381 isoform X2 [Uloborus diversus]|uniref:putative ankyrin repeat protein RF_0381 isoform X2 n=1 Tax=Uloborus diversus TaxID=327109 RepID=UPI00240A7BCD|nr:putative ankyrin repeat protein RF_0381 isoform X2 [Uloborus diversus]
MMLRKPWILCNQLLQAIETGNCDAAAKILSGGFDVDSILIDGKSAVCVCVEKGCFEIAHMLIEKGCSLSLKTYRGESPLHLAVQQSNYALVELLLKNRADVTCINLLGQTALHMACERNSLDIAALLINNSKRSIINIPDSDGATPLMYACHFGSISMVRHLLEKGGDVNAVDVRGNSPLLVAVLNSHCSVEMLKIILEAGADVYQSNHTHETALLRALHLMCLNWPKSPSHHVTVTQPISERSQPTDQRSDLLSENC